jgi:hypothetical protein
MNMKPFFLPAILVISACLTGLAQGGVPIQKANEEWEAQTYPHIGLKLQLPHWKVDVEDQSRMWSLLGYPLVANPAADVQYRVTISVNKLTDEQYRRLFRKAGTNVSDWANSEHLQTSQMTNAFWIYSRRDICGTNGFAYTCTGRIKRIQNRKPEDLNIAGGNEQMLALEVRRILDSIEVISTNSVTKP